MLGKAKQPVILFLVAFILMLISMLLKMLHYPGTQLVADAAIIVQVISVIWLLRLFFKPRLPATIFLLGFIFFVVGLLFKIQHWPGALLIIWTAIIMQIIPVICLILAIAKSPKN